MLHLKLPLLDKLDIAIQEYYLKAAGAGEIVRQRLTEELYLRWRGFALPFPGSIDNYDYWYFVHIFSQDKHICRNRTKYPLSFTRFHECWVESFSDENAGESSEVLAMLFRIARDKKVALLNLVDLSKPTRYLSRHDSDLLLEMAGGDALSMLGFSPEQYTLMHIPLEIYLQGIGLKLWGKFPLYTHLDGYRRRDDGVVASLFAGNFSSKTLPCIDSYFIDFGSRHLISRYMIRKSV